MSFVPQSLRRPPIAVSSMLRPAIYIGHILPYVTQAVVIIQFTTRFPSKLRSTKLAIHS